MVEMHLLGVNVDYQYNAIYALGVVTSYQRFMQGYRPEADKDAIFDAICQAMQYDPHRYRQDAQRLLDAIQHKSAQDVVTWVEQSVTSDGDDLQQQLKAIADNPKFKYSRLLAIGLFTLLETVDADAVKQEAQREKLLGQLCTALRLPQDKVQKDLELYRSNLEKMAQAQAVMADMLEAERKKREDKQKNSAAPPSVEASSIATDLPNA